MSYLHTSYAGYSAEQCFELTPSEAQVACSSQHLNVTEPPSIYSFEEYPFLWESVTCMLSNVTYSDRIDLADNFNWCSVPLKGSDAFLFVSLALIIAGVLFGKLSAVWVLVAGGVVGTINNYANLLQVSNGIAIWLGISPPDLFFYAFLPPLLVDSAIRIDFFMFSKLWIHILMMAFVMVILSALILTPLILFVLGFSSRGFTWVHGALFAAMIASTDALAATAILKQGGGPEKLVVLMEGEALLNDASAITLFEVFSHILEAHPGAHDVPSVWSAIPLIIEDIVKLASIGAGVGLGMSIATGYLLRWLRWRGAKPAVETTIVLAVAYLSFYVGQSPAEGSGVISVVVFGLWGNYTSKWGMLASTEESGSFDAFWDTISFASNGLVFFWAGVASINYFIRSIDILGGNAWSYAAIPLIYIFMMLIRTGCLALFNISVFAWIRERLTWFELLFTGWSGLRGAISLIMTADFIAHSAFLQGNLNDPEDPMRDLDRVNSDISIWTASFVVLTLCINAPSISMVMHWLRLDRIPREKQEMRAKAKRALMRFTGAAINTLREDDEEFLQGANWEAVSQYVDVSSALKKFDPPPPPPPPPGSGGVTVAVAAGESEGGVEADKAGAEEAGATTSKTPSLLSRKSIVHGMSRALMAPLTPFLGSASAAQPVDAEAGADTDASATDRSRKSRRARGIFRPSSTHRQLGQTEGDTRERMGRQRRRRHSAVDAKGRPFSSGAGFSSDEDTDSDLDESDTSYDSDSSGSGRGGGGGVAGPDDLFRDSDGSAGLLLEEVVEECPFIQTRARPAPEGAAAEEQKEESREGDIEMGLAPGVPLAAVAAAAVTGAATAAASAAREAASGARDAASQMADSFVAAVSPEAPQGGGGEADAAAPEPAASAGAAPGGEEDESLGAEHLAFIRQRQLSQQQRRPALGSIFILGSDGEQASPRVASPGGDSPGAAPSGGFPRAGSLQTITEHQQQVPEQGEAWHQHPGPSAPASEAGGDADLYYSSMPAALGRQLQRQLQQHQASPQVSFDAPQPPPPAAEVAQKGGSMAVQPAAEDMYYSSMPAATGRHLARQLQQELAAIPPPLPAVMDAAADVSPTPDAGSSPDFAPLSEAATRPSAAAVPASPHSAEPPGYYSSLPAAVGRQLGAQLRQEMAAAAAEAAAAATTVAPALAAGGSPDQPQQAPPPMRSGLADLPAAYYSSLPASVGRKLAEELKQERLIGTGEDEAPQKQPAEVQRVPSVARVAREEAESNAAYYSSLPAKAGQSLQQELQKQLAAGATEEQSKQQQAAAAAAAASEIQPADSPAAAEGPAADHYSTMPAAMGRSMQQQLARQLSQEAPSEAGSRGSSAEPGSATSSTAAAAVGSRLGRRVPGFGGEQRRPPRPGSMRPSPNESTGRPPSAAAAAAAGLHASRKPSRLASQPPARGHPSWEDYHHTVTGAAGPGLQAELQRQLQHQRPATGMAVGHVAGLPQRDLLGRKISQPLSTAGSGSVAESPPSSVDLTHNLSSASLMPLSARGPTHARTPSGDSSRHPVRPWTSGGVATPLPAVTPLSAHLQMRRQRTMERSRSLKLAQSSGPISFALPVPSPLESGETTRLHHRRNETYGSLTQRSSEHAASHDTSWQHKPVIMRSMSRPNLARTSATLANVVIEEEEGGSGAAVSPAPPVAVASVPLAVLSRTYSGPALANLASSAKKPGKTSSVLHRFSYAGSAGSAPGSSLHGGSAFAAAAAADGGGKFVHFDSTTGVAFTEGALSEMRSRLIAGLKRYYHSKRMEGLLSVQGLRILEYACDHAAEHTVSALGMWQLLEHEVAGNLTTRIMARCLMLVARSWRSSPRWLQATTSWPVKKVSGFLRRLLGQRMLVSCEVAVEYYLSLIHSPQIQWLQQSDEAWPLQQEVEGQVDAAYRFIIDREIEAPDRFQAIQSYRAAMAVLRQQLTFVHELYESGMVDEGEKDDMLAPVDKRMRHLEITGPVWKPPRPRTVLRGLPFMQAVPDDLFRLILQAGTIKGTLLAGQYKTGVVFWASSDLPAMSEGQTGPGAFVVLSGVVRRVHQRPDGSVKASAALALEYFQGIGGVVGALQSMTGVRLPGSEAAVAEGNTLGKGPMLFHVPQGAVHLVKQRAAEGDAPAQLLRLQLLRLAAAFVTESCDTDVAEAVRFHLLQMAAAKTQRQLKRRSHRHTSSTADGDAPTGPGSPHASASQKLHRQSVQPQEGGGRAPSSLKPGLGRTSSLARMSSWQQHQLHTTASTSTEGGPSQAQQLQRQALATQGGLRHSKSFGGHLAELMQQIAKEEFEELKRGDGGAAGQHLAQVEEGGDEQEVASPHHSEGTSGFVPGGSSTDLPTLAATASGAAAANGTRAATNGHAEEQGSLPTTLKRPAPLERGVSSPTAVAAAAVKASRTMRQRARAAEKRAPQYAAEVLSDIKRGLSAGILLDLPPGAPFWQSTHTILLRGQLAAAGPPLQPAADASTQPPLTPRSSLGLGPARSGSLGPGISGDAGWEADLAALAASAAAPVAPRLLPWLWSPRYRCNATSGARLATEQQWRAGPQGALLLVTLTEGGEVPEGVVAAEEMMEAEEQARAEAEAAAAQRAGPQSHPLDLAASGGGGRENGEGGSGGGQGASRQIQRIATLAAAPAQRATSGLMRLMPWQHRHSRGPSSQAISEAGDLEGGAAEGGPALGSAGSAGPSSLDGSWHGTPSHGPGLRVSLERLASSKRGDASSRAFHSAR